MKHVVILTILALRLFSVGAQVVDKQTLVYADSGQELLRLDRYSAATDAARPAPCLIFLFGGGFSGGARDTDRYVPWFEYMARQGWQVLSIDYRLGMKEARPEEFASPQGFAARLAHTIGMAVEDLYRATSFAVDRAGEWGIDPRRIVIVGSSAGAITVLQAEYGRCNGDPAARRLLPDDFAYAGVVSFAGAIFSPTPELVWAQRPAPMLLFHGDADSNVPFDKVGMEGLGGFFGSAYIARQLAVMASPRVFYRVEDAAHEISESPMNEQRYQIDAFLEELVMQRLPLIVDTQVRRIDWPQQRKEFTIEDYIRTNYLPQ